MPQMSPISWLTLFIFFLMIFFIFNIMNYYIFNYNIKIQQKNKKLTLFNWKW
uniref:ATP synthase complex subunit 8 n=1 Tax=Batocera lineolata TaxID=583388 RepID=U5HSD2_BATLI|nr:ATP synthase F0 subunit 8 [Batocera lineolata]AEV21654.1 ATP synthase F0 subunit 8 [Batocera lineolata]ATN28875.1 ATP synthase F0 subunit 8 [Batocera lineolata]